MAKQLQLTIPKPCHEDWDVMTPADKGRFCGSCQKQVVDFSTMSDRQVAEFFKKPRTGSVCGRFMSDQLEREIEIPKKRIPWVKYFFHFALPAFLLSIKSSSAKAQGEVKIRKTETPIKNNLERPKLIGDTILMDEIIVLAQAKQPTGKDFSIYPKVENSQLTNLLSGRFGCFVVPMKKELLDIAKVRDLSVSALYKNITGSVVDETGASVPGATIKIKDTRIGVLADNNGKFILNIKEGTTLLVTGAGLEPAEFQVREERSIEIVVRKAWVGEVAVVVGKRKNDKQENSTQLHFLNVDTAQNFFKVFPNPIIAGTSVTIEAKKIKEGNYTLQLLNQSGQSIHRKEIWVDGKGRYINMNVPVVAGGSYFLVLTNEKTGKKYSEKIIIQ